MPVNNYLEELTKIAEDMSGEPMNPDPRPPASEKEVAEMQGVSEEELAAAQAAVTAQGQIQPSEEEVMNELEADEAASQMTPEETAAVEQAIIEEIEAQGGLEAEQQLPEGDPGEVPQEVELPPEEEEIVEAMEEEQVANEIIDELREKVASELVSLATIAKVVECSRGGEGISEELQKQASDIIEEMLEGEAAFNNAMERVASEIFAVEENVDQLFSRDGIQMVFEQLASLDAEGFDKQADEAPSAIARLRDFATDAIANTKKQVVEVAHSAANLKGISAELEQAAEAIRPIDAAATHFPDKMDMLISPEELAAFPENSQRIADLTRQQKMGRGAIGVGAGIAAAGAAYGGKKLYDHMHEEEKIAGVLPDGFAGGTLDVGSKNENTGGIQKMSRELVNDFLKVAGAAGLVSISSDESLDMDIRKEASDAFDEIASMGRAEMDETLSKVATQIYSEDQLHEIVAGLHTEELFDKVAFFVDAVDAPVGEIMEKVANAGGVSAIKNIGPGLKQSATNILNTIKDGKDAAEGAGRGYIGALKGDYGKGAKGIAGAGTATGLAGGGLVGAGSMAGYNVLNNPSQYGIEQTASDLEEAVMLKKAAVETFKIANDFIQQYRNVR